MIPIKNQEIRDYVNSLTNFQKEIVLAIREAVLSADKRVQESIKWGSIAFHNNRNICGFRVTKAHITLLFMEGVSLTDSENILEGTGAKARTYKVKDVKEVRSKALSGLIKQALELGM